ncbi:uncharacterized protein LOC117124445 [Anneissia japonica]|uniref:uncharacterized protein LOC117124445 n=1 Tax=Anneissia japonica TaxID=1529436 RepID=UPI0014255154|nr:uncharacterized protein LOC117124445 [Anneissia japonica]
MEMSSLPKAVLALCILSTCLVTLLAEVVPVCTPVESSTGPPLPELPQKYSTSVEANDLQNAYSQDIEEFYDGNRGTIRTVDHGIETLLIYDYSTDEEYTVIGSSIGPGFYTEDNLPQCTIQRLSSDPNQLPYTINDIARFAALFEEEYIGTEEIRGIPTNHWRACINETGLNSFYADYFFTVPGYATAYGSDQIPVRVVINGTSQNANTSETNDITNVYEFAFFRPTTKYNPYIFQTPRGVYCEGREKFNLTKPLPTIPEDIRMRIEIISPNARRIENTDAWLSETFKLVRYDHTAVVSRSDLYYDVGDTISEIHDYNTSVAYIINKRIGTCVVLPISNTSYEAVPTDPAHVRMRTAQELFFGLTDMNYEYEGEKYIRNILTDTWIGEGSETLKEQTYTSTWEWFFTAENWTENMVSSDSVPIRIDIRSKPEVGILEPFIFALSIYEFRASINDFTVFDASTCFAENQKKILQFQISGDSIGYVIHSPTLFLKSCQFSIAENARVSFVRVAKVTYDYDDVKIYVTFTLLDKAPIDGDIYNPTDEISLSEAFDTLEKSINREELIIYMNVNDKQYEFVAIPYSLRSDVIFPPDYPFQGDTTVCDPQESRIEKPVPVFYESFQVYMEAKILNEPAYTTEAIQYFDSLSLRTSIFTSTPSGVLQIISDLKEFNVYTIYPNGNCTAYHYELESFLQANLESSFTGELPVISLRIGMELTKLYGATYKGTTLVRGIPVDWWRSCVFIPQTQSTFSFDWYFTTEGYKSASLASPIPVRTVVEGKGLRFNDLDAPAHTFKHIYEYSGFKPEVIDSLPKLLIPSGVLCVNDTQRKPLPELPEYSSVRTEIRYKDETDFNRQRLDVSDHYNLPL